MQSRPLVPRAYHLSSSLFYFDEKINFLRHFFTSTGYPAFIFDAICQKFLDNIYTTPTVPPVILPNMQFYFSVVYYNYASEHLIPNLTNRLSIFYRQISLLAVNKNYFTIGRFFMLQDEIRACVRVSIIYKFTCGERNASYLGCSRDLRLLFTNIWVRQKD